MFLWCAFVPSEKKSSVSRNCQYNFVHNFHMCVEIEFDLHARCKITMEEAEKGDSNHNNNYNNDDDR